MGTPLLSFKDDVTVILLFYVSFMVLKSYQNNSALSLRLETRCEHGDADSLSTQATKSNQTQLNPTKPNPKK
jgi:hypothetical protein